MTERAALPVQRVTRVVGGLVTDETVHGALFASTWL
jgi:hypothetical protein